jgi:LAGLIDADG DNA endonuclease family
MHRINKDLLKKYKQRAIDSGPNSKRAKVYKFFLTNLSTIQFEAAIGLMLGDASLQTQCKGIMKEITYRMKFEWSDKNKPYVDHVHELFDEWIYSKPHKKTRTNSNGNVVTTWGFQTISHKAFNKLSELFLLNNKKSISQNLIKNYLTERGLAYWFMDDGGKLDYNINSNNLSVVLNTHSFTDKEVETMAIELGSKFSLKCSTRKNKGKSIIVIDSSSYTHFFNLIEKYLLPEMKYKLPKVS